MARGKRSSPPLNQQTCPQCSQLIASRGMPAHLRKHARQVSSASSAKTISAEAVMSFAPQAFPSPPNGVGIGRALRTLYGLTQHPESPDWIRRAAAFTVEQEHITF